MKEWQPDQEFERADFAGAKKAPPKPPAPLWSPDLEFERADFRSAPPSKKEGPAPPASTPAGPAADAGGESEKKREVRRWIPGAGGDKMAPAKVSAERIVSPGAAAPAAGAKAAANTPGSPPVQRFHAAMMRDLALARRETARHILRRWFWEKSEQAPPALRGLAAHDRIQIVLSLLGLEAARSLLAMMTPEERRQMVQILKRPNRRFATNEIALARDAFMEALRQGDEL